MSRGKKYNESAKKYDKAAVLDLPAAVETVKKLEFAKFDETVDISVKVNLGKSQSVRDTVVVPHQFRAEKRILVFCKSEKEQEAKDAGAAFTG